MTIWTLVSWPLFREARRSTAVAVRGSNDAEGVSGGAMCAVVVWAFLQFGVDVRMRSVMCSWWQFRRFV